MTTDWANLEGHAVRGDFPLLRVLASSERSAVFLSQAAAMTPSEVAVKLVAASDGDAGLLLARWRSALSLDQPHLVRLFEAGECELSGQRYVYLAMEYAEQNLAELLEHRALVPEEAREMLGPILNALESLHGAKKVHGALKPSNVLVVGEQIKLASDAIAPASDVVSADRAHGGALSPYEPPEAETGARSAAGDVWALGVTTCEALSRRKPAGLHAIGGGIALPADIPSMFAEMISKCLSRRPEDRPDVAQLQAWQKGGVLELKQGHGQQPGEPAPVRAPEQQAAESASVRGPEQQAAAESAFVHAPERQAAESAPMEGLGQQAAESMPVRGPEPQPAELAPARGVGQQGAKLGPVHAPELQGGVTNGADAAASPAAPIRLVIRAELVSPDEGTEPAEPKAHWRPLRLIAAAVVVLAIAAAGIYFFSFSETPQVASAPASDSDVSPDRARSAAPASEAATSQAASPEPTSLPATRAPASQAQTWQAPAAPAPSATASDTTAVVNQVMPSVPRSASQTIRGTVRVSVRVIVDEGGNVVAATPEDPGPSRYFERLSLEAAKQWLFAPAERSGDRLMLVKFNYTRFGATANATPAP